LITKAVFEKPIFNRVEVKLKIKQMADIQISVNNDDLFAIQLDKWEWETLHVNGVSVQPINRGNIQFDWTQETPGPVTFTATANHHLIIENPGNHLHLESTDGKKTYLLLISYSTNPDNTVTLSGGLHTFNVAIPNEKNSPIKFSQGRMTGRFCLTDS
jgi:hypothetical protein